MPKNHIIVIAILCGIVLVAGFFAVKSTTKDLEPTPTSVDTQLVQSDNHPYTNVNGISVDMAPYKGKVLVVNSWATWSPFSKQELLNMSVVDEEFKSDGVVMLAINRAEPQNKVKSYIQSQLNNPKNITFLLDTHDIYFSSIGGYAMPETVIYNRDGSISLHKRGALTPEELRDEIKKALQAT